MKKIYVIAGEASGDLHGARLIGEIRAELGRDSEIYGVGGDKIRDTGALRFLDIAHFHVTGITDALKRLPQYREASQMILTGIREVRPDLVVLIDNPGFNLHLAKKIKSLGIPVVYYIAPQVWAWAPKRIFKIKDTVKKVLVVFEFEKKIYEAHGIPVVWVGHPLKDITENIHPSATQKPFIALLPGSRKGELEKLFTIVAKTAAKIAGQIPGVSFGLIKAPTLPKEFYERLMKNQMRGLRCTLVEENAYRVLRASDLAIACSGTATLECALLGTPMVIINKGSLLTYVIAKSMIRVPYLGMPNLLLGREAFPELLQHEATPDKIAKKAVQILKDKTLRDAMQKDLEEVSRIVGPPGASRRAAQEIIKRL